jgi:adenosylhomocysteine nucleosidase
VVELLFLMRRGPVRKAAALAFGLAVLLGSAAAAGAAETLDRTPRTAVISAFRPEWAALRAALRDREGYVVNGTSFETGTIEGKPVVLFLSGVSMVNAAMTSQLALDRFTVARVVFSGIAGGVDPALAIGDVVVPERWSEYLEAVFARETDGTYVLPGFADRSVANFGMMFPQPVEVANGTTTQPERRLWFPVDAGLLSVARAVAGTVHLGMCVADSSRCLPHRPKVLVGGNGVSGQAFVDNAAFREYVQRAFEAEVVDMESAAVAHVAYANRVPFIAFRSLSDLAGGGAGENEMETFLQLASANSAAVVEAFLKALP